MGRLSLERAGFDPSEGLTMTPEIAAGAALMLYFVEHKRLPAEGDMYEQQSVKDMADIPVGDEDYWQAYQEIKTWQEASHV